jgi:phosphoribosylamine--glycine ligase
VALGENFAAARAKAYAALDHIHLQGGQYRTDIAERVA